MELWGLGAKVSPSIVEQILKAILIIAVFLKGYFYLILLFAKIALNMENVH